MVVHRNNESNPPKQKHRQPSVEVSTGRPTACSRHQRDDATLSALPAAHLFGCAVGHTRWTHGRRSSAAPARPSSAAATHSTCWPAAP